MGTRGFLLIEVDLLVIFQPDCHHWKGKAYLRMEMEREGSGQWGASKYLKLALKVEKALVCSIYQVPWYKFSLSGECQSINMTSLNIELGGNVQSQLLQAGASWLQPTGFSLSISSESLNSPGPETRGLY